jgi:hypothetical protein
VLVLLLLLTQEFAACTACAAWAAAGKKLPKSLG